MEKSSPKMDSSTLQEFLDEKAAFYENPVFIDSDPIQIPHQFQKRQDIEIAGLLTSIIAWGNRTSILNSARKMMGLLDHDPYAFISGHSPKELRALDGFVHRTFQTADLQFMIQALQHAYSIEDSLENFFIGSEQSSMAERIHHFRAFMLQTPHEKRSEKHLADPFKGSAAKRIHMFLRWMVRSNTQGVDFGIWNQISTADLSCPLDVHSGNVARKLGLLKRQQNDAKAVAELDQSLRRMDPKDPVKYDFALFGLGVFENF